MLDDDDHRAIARRLGLLHFQEEAPGMVFWHPRGLAMYRALEDAQRAQVRREGYEEVRSPQVMRRPIWEASGHWKHFAEGMMRIDDDELEAALKPVSCPGHAQIVKRMAPSYRDLPIRLAELGVVHRDEASGALHGLMRLRQFSQDDGHVFCEEAQAEDEVVRFLEGLRPFYAQFGFHELDVALSLRPEDRAGDDAVWDRAEAVLARALDRRGEKYRVQEGAGAFYGPKIEVALRDRAGRLWQCGTIQMDLVMPVRFDLRYVDARGEKQPVVMLHRALYGSLERFLGILLEQHGASLPAWLAPEQIVVVPVSGAQHEIARALVRKLERDGARVSIDAREESLARRIAEAHERGVPHVAIVGAREVERGEVALRSRDGQRVLAEDDARALLREALARPERAS
ncbi:threonine--tRNA ligase [Sandaracinus amylolyticus]|uniref:threonine--tRNA ligase n=1 Tax=Sandaracinus amylolyticus TaxID=927083 RepID=UPI001F031919|nr:threonine--tRNA ligase [Sandaracinus amylolyticus]UJR81286.1 Threonyl-tRNA synthetase [Sandaracinus amylolyticus]